MSTHPNLYIDQHLLIECVMGSCQIILRNSSDSETIFFKIDYPSDINLIVAPKKGIIQKSSFVRIEVRKVTSRVANYDNQIKSALLLHSYLYEEYIKDNIKIFKPSSKQSSIIQIPIISAKPSTRTNQPMITSMQQFKYKKQYNNKQVQQSNKYSKTTNHEDKTPSKSITFKYLYDIQSNNNNSTKSIKYQPQMSYPPISQHRPFQLLLLAVLAGIFFVIGSHFNNYFNHQYL